MKVLLATDGFEPATQATALLERLADPDRVSVTVLSVTPTGVPPPEYAALMLDVLDDRRDATIALVDQVSDRLRRAGFAVRGRTAEGHPGEEIVTIVEQDWYDLTIVGSGHASWLGQRLLGSVSMRVLHDSPSSVLVVHNVDPSPRDPRILLAVDGSRGSEFATRSIVGLIRRPAKVEVVSVVQPETFFAVPGAVAVMPYPTEAMLSHLTNAAERHLEHAAVKLRDAGFDVETTILEGGPTEQILKRAESAEVDLVVVGARGLGPFRRALLGSTSDHVVRHTRATLVGRRRTDDTES